MVFNSGVCGRYPIKLTISLFFKLRGWFDWSWFNGEVCGRYLRKLERIMYRALRVRQIAYLICKFANRDDVCVVRSVTNSQLMLTSHNSYTKTCNTHQRTIISEIRFAVSKILKSTREVLYMFFLKFSSAGQSSWRSVVNCCIHSCEQVSHRFGTSNYLDLSSDFPFFWLCYCEALFLNFEWLSVICIFLRPDYEPY